MDAFTKTAVALDATFRHICDRVVVPVWNPVERVFARAYRAGISRDRENGHAPPSSLK